MVSIKRYFSSGIVSGCVPPPYLTEPHAVKVSNRKATIRRRTLIRRRQSEKVPDGSRPLRSVMLVAGANQQALPDAVERHRAAPGAERDREQPTEREQDLSSGDPVGGGAQAGKPKGYDHRQAEPDRGRRNPGGAQGEPAGSRPHQGHEAVRHGQQPQLPGIEWWRILRNSRPGVADGCATPAGHGPSEPELRTHAKP